MFHESLAVLILASILVAQVCLPKETIVCLLDMTLRLPKGHAAGRTYEVAATLTSPNPAYPKFEGL